MQVTWIPKMLFIINVALACTWLPTAWSSQEGAQCPTFASENYHDCKLKTITDHSGHPAMGPFEIRLDGNSFFWHERAEGQLRRTPYLLDGEWHDTLEASYGTVDFFERIKASCEKQAIYENREVSAKMDDVRMKVAQYYSTYRVTTSGDLLISTLELEFDSGDMEKLSSYDIYCSAGSE